MLVHKVRKIKLNYSWLILIIVIKYIKNQRFFAIVNLCRILFNLLISLLPSIID